MKEKQYVSGREMEKGDRERQRERDKRIISSGLFPCLVIWRYHSYCIGGKPLYTAYLQQMKDTSVRFRLQLKS